MSDLVRDDHDVNLPTTHTLPWSRPASLLRAHTHPLPSMESIFWWRQDISCASRFWFHVPIRNKPPSRIQTVVWSDIRPKKHVLHSIFVLPVHRYTLLISYIRRVHLVLIWYPPYRPVCVWCKKEGVSSGKPRTMDGFYIRRMHIVLIWYFPYLHACE